MACTSIYPGSLCPVLKSTVAKRDLAPESVRTEGSAHLYMLPWLRYAGSINIPKILHELDPSSDQRASEASLGALEAQIMWQTGICQALKHMQLMALPENLPVPVGIANVHSSRMHKNCKSGIEASWPLMRTPMCGSGACGCSHIA
eukprot:4660705-Amphidinium_carterae.3